MWDWALMIGLLIPTYLLRKKKRYGWLVYAAYEVAWFVYGWRTSQWAFALAAVCFMVWYVSNYRAWGKNEGAVSDLTERAERAEAQVEKLHCTIDALRMTQAN